MLPPPPPLLFLLKSCNVKGVKYIGSLLDHSGYGEAARNYVLALHRAGVPITIEARRFEPDPPPVGTSEERAILLELMNKKIDFDIVIIHLTPDLVPAYINKYPDKYIINYTVWETSRLHPLWVASCNKSDEVWVPCDWNVAAFKESGVTVPVYKILHGIDPDIYNKSKLSNFSISGVDEDTFVFTSVMQWCARKNPAGLLRAYFNAFGPEDNVRLVLKAYVGRGGTPAQEADQIKNIILRIKTDMQLKYYPKINLIADSLSSEQMKSLYTLSDAYISLTHGEGFGLTPLEAGLAGKPIIVTGMGGNMEYMTAENSYPVPFIWDYVSGMGTFNQWYWGDQQWAYPDLPAASRLMRHVYINREEAQKKGALLQSDIKEKFNWKIISGQMLNRLKEL